MFQNCLSKIVLMLEKIVAEKQVRDGLFKKETVSAVFVTWMDCWTLTLLGS